MATSFTETNMSLSQTQPYHASASALQPGPDPSSFSESWSLMTDTWQNGGQWAGGADGSQHLRHGRNHHFGSHRISPYPQAPSSRRSRTSAIPSVQRERVRLNPRPRYDLCQEDTEAIAHDYAGVSGNFEETTNFQLEGRYEDPHTLASGYDTINHGEGSQTYNNSRVFANRKSDRSSSAVVHVHVHGSNSSGESTSSNSLSRSPSSSSSMPVTPPTSHGDSPINPPDSAQKQGREMTRSEQYTSLLLGCGIGYPLWKPSPRRTLDPGAEYIVTIGDVGIVKDGLPFDTLFNITQPTNSLANRRGVPEGVDPPCPLDPSWVTVDESYHQEWTTLIRPKSSVSHQGVEYLAGSRMYNFTMSNRQGALLFLPKGGILKNLERKGEFRKRIKSYWRQWCDFAEQEGDLEERQSLYIVTGVERCPAWALSVWDPASGDHSDSLKLYVNESDGGCSWIHSTARCEAQSLKRPSCVEGPDASKHTVFVRGFWVNKFNAEMNIGFISPLTRSSGPDNGVDGDNHFGGNGGSYNHPSSGFPSTQAVFQSTSARSEGYTDSSGLHGEATDYTQGMHIESLSVDSLGFLDSVIESPCEIINQFAYAVIARIRPEVLEGSCVVFSHDDDWISIVKESDDAFPTKMDFIRRICGELKFILEDGIIHSSRLTNDETGLVRRSLAPLHNSPIANNISLVVEFRETDATPIATSVAELPQKLAAGSTNNMKMPAEENEHPSLETVPSSSSASSVFAGPSSQVNVAFKTLPADRAGSSSRVLKMGEQTGPNEMEEMRRAYLNILAPMPSADESAHLPLDIEALKMIPESYSIVPDEAAGSRNLEDDHAASHGSTSSPAINFKDTEFFDFSTYWLSEEDDASSKASTPELISSFSGDPSPASVYELGFDSPMITQNEAKPEDVSGPLAPGTLKEIEGGESTYFQPNELFWEGEGHRP